MPLPIYAETIAGEVMHDLGELQLVKDRVPTLADAKRFAAHRLAQGGYDTALAAQVGTVAIADYRATERLRGQPTSYTISDAFTGLGGGGGTIGVRVVLDISYDGPRPPGALNSASVLVNVGPGDSVQDAINRAMSAWNARAVQTRHGGRSGGRAVDGMVVQIVAGGFAQAQIST